MKKQNITLIIGLLIPVFMILFVAGAIYLPTLFINVNPPKYNFVYMINNYNNDYKYTVIKNRLTREKIERKNNYSTPNQRPTKFFIHDITTHKNTELSFEEASALNINDKIESPDGFKVENGRRSFGFFPFYNRGNYYTRYLTKEGYSEKLKLHTTDRNYYYNFLFLGWIEK